MKINGQYAEDVDHLIGVMLEYINGAPDPIMARQDFLDGLVTVYSAPGVYRLTSGGRTRWEGETLAGAITVLTSEDYPAPRRIWHIDEFGRHLVLLDDGNDTTEVKE